MPPTPRRSSSPAPAPASAHTEAPSRVRILSLDGGGVRGLMTAVWLDRLEQELGSPIRDHVDLVAGTSTGSIIACAVAQGIPASRLRDLYMQRGREIFPGAAGRAWSRFTRVATMGLSMPKYDDAGLRRELRTVLGETPFGTLPTPTMIVTYDTLAREALVIKSWRDPADYPFASVPAWKLVAASCAAPTYFPAQGLRAMGREMSLIDGGVAANNPAACAVAEVLRAAGSRPVDKARNIAGVVVVSMGTGQVTRPIPLRDAREWGTLEWAACAVDVLMDGSQDVTDYIVRQIVGDAHSVRVQTPLDRAYDDMDNASPANLDALEATALRHLQGSGAAELSKAVTLLRAGGVRDWHTPLD